MIKRILKYTGLFLLLLVLLVVGGLSWVIGTEKGFQQTLALAKKYAPGELSWDKADGKLAGPLQLKGLRYAQDDVIEAKVRELDFDWQPSALFGAELVIEQLQLNDVELHLPEASDTEDGVQESDSDAGLPDISLPVAISLKDIAVNKISIYPAAQGTPIEIDRVALSGSLERSDVQLDKFEVIAPQGELHLQGNVGISDTYPMDLALDWQADIGQSIPLNGEANVHGSLVALQIDHQLKGFAIGSLEASVNNVMQSPAWDASVDVSLPDAEALSELLLGTPQVTIVSSGTLEAYQAQAMVNVSTSETGPVAINADIGGSAEMLDVHSFVATLSESGGEFTAAGQLRFATLYSDFKGQWQALGWPVSGDPQFNSEQGSFAITGSLDNFKASISTAVNGTDIPSGQWDVSAEGSSTALNNFVVLGETLDGTVAAIGNAAWEAQADWDVQLVTEGINPGSQWADFPGSINLEINSKGHISEDGPQLSAEIKRLSGSLREQALSGQGLIHLAGEQVNIEQLELALGDSELLANGHFDNQIALDFELVSPDLASLLPELSGGIAMSGSVSGSSNAPKLKAQAAADNIVYSGSSLSKLNFRIDAGLGPDDHSMLSVDAKGIAAGGQKISDINLKAEGSQSDHKLVFAADTEQGDVDLQLEGGYLSETWNGSLSGLELKDTAAGDWLLREPTAITANAQQANATALCLDNRNKLGSLCITAHWLALGDTTVAATVSGISPKLISDHLPAGISVKTELNGDIDALLGSDGALNADASFTLAPGNLLVESGGKPVKIGLEQTNIDASLNGDDATLELATAFTDFGKVNLQASLVDPAGEARLAGKLNADFRDLTLITAFAPQLQQVSGRLKSKLTLAGTVDTPLIEGEMALENFGAEIPETAMLIKNTQLSIKGNPDGTLLISGKSSSGDGQLKIKGQVNPATQTIELNLSGDQYEVANTAMMQAVISPQLSIGMDNAGMRVHGKVTIPRVYINANGGSEGIKTVSSSSDVVYVSEAGEQEESPASQLDLDVQIILGDSVEVEAGDFRGKLEGDLRVQQTPELAPLGTGTINVVNGDYVIYGQQLNMERGRILFSGGPVDNPSLDMEVARTVQEYDVVAGAKIQGTAQTPRLELYSDPPMPDASILSYILLGQPPGTTGGSYTLGKYLTPELYVSYGIGLFDAINTFNMRYKLTDKLAVEAESGSGSSADLIYTIEK